jgi:thioredoxin 1
MFLAGCGLGTGFGVAAKPTSESAWNPLNRTARTSSSLVAMEQTEAIRQDPAIHPASTAFSLHRPPGVSANDGAGHATAAEPVSLTTTETIAEPVSEATARVPRPVERVNHRDFDRKVLDAGEVVLVDFYADWCGPCKRLAPVLDELARETPDARVVKVNIDHSPELADQYAVRSVPTLIVFKNGKPVARRMGLNSKRDLQSLLALHQ